MNNEPAAAPIEPSGPPENGPLLKSELFNWADALVTALIFIVLLFALVVRTSGVDGLSMYPTLNDRDQLLISHLFYTPKKGDIVVIRKESFMSEPIVKRIIATEGDKIDIDFERHIVYVNDEALDEPYINAPTARSFDMTFPSTVPKGCIFVMGDNRNESTDSRNSMVGFIDTRMILGRVILRYFPIGGLGPVH